jgi:CheY-like chemotaxis protein
MKGDKEKMLDAGCDAYVSKPIDTRELPVIVADIINKGRQA